MKKLHTISFTANMVEEYSATPRRTDLGKMFHQMELHQSEDGQNGCIIWNYGRKAADEDETQIGLQFEGKKVTDYDGVFDLPREEVQLLKDAGFDVSEVTGEEEESLQAAIGNRPATEGEILTPIADTSDAVTASRVLGPLSFEANRIPELNGIELTMETFARMGGIGLQEVEEKIASGEIKAGGNFIIWNHQLDEPINVKYLGKGKSGATLLDIIGIPTEVQEVDSSPLTDPDMDNHEPDAQYPLPIDLGFTPKTKFSELMDGSLDCRLVWEPDGEWARCFDYCTNTNFVVEFLPAPTGARLWAWQETGIRWNGMFSKTWACIAVQGEKTGTGDAMQWAQDQALAWSRLDCIGQTPKPLTSEAYTKFSKMFNRPVAKDLAGRIINHHDSTVEFRCSNDPLNPCPPDAGGRWVQKSITHHGQELLVWGKFEDQF